MFRKTKMQGRNKAINQSLNITPASLYITLGRVTWKKE